jgi:3-hydroxyacyl-CoA dehydrogenase
MSKSQYTIESAAVIGAGTMGLGIAGQLANAGVPVLLLDRASEGEDRNAIARRALDRLLDERQPGLLHPDYVRRITIGNIEDDLDRLGEADWIAEAVVEQLEVKRALYRRVEAVRKAGSIVSSNTSTIPISLLVEGMPRSFRETFAITHFFNPVRFMRLLELVQGEETLPGVIDCLDTFCEARLGKGVVVCRDTPGFLGNRVGVYAIQTALHEAFRLGLSPEQADAVFGRPMGIPKTGVFGLYDLIGIDLMADVARSMEQILPPDDAFHDVSRPLPVMEQMIVAGLLGNKSEPGGFYRQREDNGDPVRETLDWESFEYRAFERSTPDLAALAEATGDLRLLIEGDSPEAQFAWAVLSRTLCYAASLVPAVSDSPVPIDDAMKLGYNWTRGPFEMIDAIGVDAFIARLEREHRPVPPFLQAAAGQGFYRVREGRLHDLTSSGGFSPLQRAPGIRRFSEERRALEPVDTNDSASYFLLDGDIGLVEWHSKANTLDGDSVAILARAVDHASRHCAGLVVHNDAPHFSCGVNLGVVLDLIDQGDFRGIDRFLRDFQETVRAMRDAPLPVIAAPVGLALGGGFEVVLHTDRVVAHANSVFGLVESLVGLVPGGGGVKEMLYRCQEQADSAGAAAWQAFKQVGYGMTAASPVLAQELAMFRPGRDDVLMNRDRMLDRAIALVREMAPGYVPAGRPSLPAAGRSLAGEMREWLIQARAKGRLVPHDVTVGEQVAMIVTGGDVGAGTLIGEQDLMALERQAFLALAATPQTRARIAHMLEYGKPLRI